MIRSLKKSDSGLNDATNKDNDCTINSYSSVDLNDTLIFNNSQLSNQLFPDILMIIESYNNFLPLYLNKEFNMINGKKNIIVQSKSYKKHIKKLNRIEYERLIDSLENDSFNVNEIESDYCLNIVKNLLLILIHLNHDLFKNCRVFSITITNCLFNFKNLTENEHKECTSYSKFLEKCEDFSYQIDSYLIQDVCRCLIQFGVNRFAKSDASFNLNKFNKNSFLYTNVVYEERYAELIEALRTIEFSEFNAHNKVLLLKALCDELVACDYFEELMEQIRCDKLNQQIDINANKLDNQSEIIPIGIDNKKSVYWLFKSLPNKLIRELNNKWYEYDILNDHNEPSDELLVILDDLKSIELTIKIKQVACDLKANKSMQLNLTKKTCVVRDLINNDVQKPIDDLYLNIGKYHKNLIIKGLVKNSLYYNEWKELYQNGVGIKDAQKKFELMVSVSLII
jgi:hypothetical protein